MNKLTIKKIEDLGNKVLRITFSDFNGKTYAANIPVYTPRDPGDECDCANCQRKPEQLKLPV